MEWIQKGIFPVGDGLYKVVGVVDVPESKKSGQPTHLLKLQAFDPGKGPVGNMVDVALYLSMYDFWFDEDGLGMLNRTDHTTAYHHSMQGMRIETMNGLGFHKDDIIECLELYARMLDEKYENGA